MILVAKHGERDIRTWRKVPLAVDSSTGEVLASELPTNEEGDASQVGPLLGQVPGQIASVTADGAYDGELTYQAVAERQPDRPVAVIIPPRSAAVPSTAADTTPSQRDQHMQMIQVKGHMGWQKAVNYGRRSLRKRQCSVSRPSSAAAVAPGRCLPRRPRSCSCDQAGGLIDGETQPLDTGSLVSAGGKFCLTSRYPDLGKK